MACQRTTRSAANGKGLSSKCIHAHTSISANNKLSADQWGEFAWHIIQSGPSTSWHGLWWQYGWTTRTPSSMLPMPSRSTQQACLWPKPLSDLLRENLADIICPRTVLVWGWGPLANVSCWSSSPSQPTLQLTLQRPSAGWSMASSCQLWVWTTNPISMLQITRRS